MEINKNALLNEYKGNLFEYLVAHELSILNHIQAQFIGSIPSGYLQMLQYQESQMRELDSRLLTLVSFCSHHMAKFINKDHHADEIYLVGKTAKNMTIRNIDEADILLRKNSKVEGISLKFTKDHAWLNTKSAGVKSFLLNYFQHQNISKMQTEFNQKNQYLFEQMSRDLHTIYETPFQQSFKNWMSNHLPVHPGELNEKAKSRLYQYYDDLKNLLISNFQILMQDQELFKKSIRNLCGFSNQNISLYVCYLGAREAKLEKIVLNDLPMMNLISTRSQSSFLIDLKTIQLQIRIKPMKTFIQPSFKVNCSIKLS